MQTTTTTNNKKNFLLLCPTERRLPPQHIFQSNNKATEQLQNDKMAKELFNQIAASADHKTKTEKYKTLLDQYIANQQVNELKAFVDHMLEEKTPLVISRTLLQAFAVALPNLKPELHKEIGIASLLFVCVLC